jgi:hypothetical protein
MAGSGEVNQGSRVPFSAAMQVRGRFPDLDGNIAEHSELLLLAFLPPSVSCVANAQTPDYTEVNRPGSTPDATRADPHGLTATDRCQNPQPLTIAARRTTLSGDGGGSAEYRDSGCPSCRGRSWAR